MKRLDALAGLVRQGVCVADVGCDHAKLAIRLACEGIAARVVATELNKLPLEKARRAISEAGLGGVITLLCADGLRGVPAEAADDIVIAGMGGELISHILEDSGHFHLPGKRFILQPMSRAGELRRWLAQWGFPIEREVLSRENGRTFVVLQCGYTGQPYALSEEEILIGPHILCENSPLAEQYIARLRRIRDKAEAGRSKAGTGANHDDAETDNRFF